MFCNHKVVLSEVLLLNGHAKATTNFVFCIRKGQFLFVVRIHILKAHLMTLLQSRLNPNVQ